jgi:hypothetical protein
MSTGELLERVKAAPLWSRLFAKMVLTKMVLTKMVFLSHERKGVALRLGIRRAGTEAGSWDRGRDARCKEDADEAGSWDRGRDARCKEDADEAGSWDRGRPARSGCAVSTA